MRRAMRAAACVALAAVGRGGDDEPMECHDIGYQRHILRAEVDLLVLVGNASSMIEEQAALAEQVAQVVDELESMEGGRPDLHAAVMSDDGGRLLVPATCPSSDGSDFLIDVMVEAATGTREFNYGGDLASQLACMVEVGTAGDAVERPLGSLAQALEDEAGFRRPEAALAIAIVTDGEDASPDEVASYADRVQAVAATPASTRVTVASGGPEGCTRDGFTEAAPAARLAEFAAGFGADGAAVSLCGDDPLLAGVAAIREQPSAGACIGAENPTDCRVADVSGDEEWPLPSCDDADPPCFWIAENAATCPDTSSHLHLVVHRGDSEAPEGTVGVAGCRPECP